MLVVPFSKSLGPITGPTDDRKTVVESIGRIMSQGGTAILDSLVESAPFLGAIEGRRAVVLITDGYDEHSAKRLRRSARCHESIQATVYVVGIGGVAGISLQRRAVAKRLAAADRRARVPAQPGRRTRCW